MNALKELGNEYRDPTIVDAANVMADRLCLEYGYDSPDLVARPLRILGEAMNMQLGISISHGLSRVWDGVPIDKAGREYGMHNFLTKLLETNNPENTPIELVWEGVGSLARPTDGLSLLSSVIEGLSSREEGFGRPFPKYDVVNTKVVSQRIGWEAPATEIERPEEIFRRFKVDISKDRDGKRPKNGVPRVVITNNYKTGGHHFSMSIEIPDEQKQYQRIFDLLIARDVNDLDSAREQMQEIRRKPNQLLDQTMMDLAIECAGVALENGFYPYGAAYRGFDGKIIIARNNTASDEEQEGHAEFEVLNLVRRDSPGTLYTMMEPCQSCSMKMMAKPVVQIVCA